MIFAHGGSESALINYISHSSRKRKPIRYTNKNVLYIRRVELPNGKWRYFYTTKAYEAWLNNQQPSKEEQDEKKRKNIKIWNLRKTYMSAVKETGYRSKESRRLLNEIHDLESS